MLILGDSGRDVASLAAGDDIFRDNAQDDIRRRDGILGGDGNDTLIGGGTALTLAGVTSLASLDDDSPVVWGRAAAERSVRAPSTHGATLAAPDL